MNLILRASRFVWAHRTIALLVVACWNVLTYFIRRAERVPHNILPELPLIFAAIFALFSLISLWIDRRRKMFVER